MTFHNDLPGLTATRKYFFCVKWWELGRLAPRPETVAMLPTSVMVPRIREAYPLYEDDPVDAVLEGRSAQIGWLRCVSWFHVPPV